MIKLLIADDLLTIRFSLMMVFRGKPGYSVFTAASGEETLKVIEKENPDLVLLDIVLPDISGWEIVRRLKEKNSPVRIIFITITGSVRDEELVERIKASGARGLIAKPLEVHHLEDRIKELVPELWDSS